MALVKKLRREYLYIGILMAIFVAGSYWLHVNGDSILVQSESLWEKRVTYHEEVHPPSMRHFTTYLMRFGHDVLGLSFLSSFKVIQFILYFIVGISFHAYLRQLKFSPALSLFGVVMFVGSYPMLFAHFAPVYVWDDFWQYLALILSFHMILKDRPILASVLLAIGLVAREATVVLYPVYVYALLCRVDWKSRTALLAVLLPLICLGVNYALHFHPPAPGRFSLFYRNFIDSSASANVVFSLLVSFGVIWVASLLALVSNGRKLFADPRRSFLVVGALYGAPITVLFTLTMALARETRLFFPPFVFLIPLALYFVSVHREVFLRFYSRFLGLLGFAVVLGAIWVGQIVAPILFPTFEFRTSPEWTQIYFGIHIALFIVLVIPLVVKLFGVASRYSADPYKQSDAIQDGH